MIGFWDVSKQVLGMLHDTLHMARCFEDMVLCFQNVLRLWYILESINFNSGHA